MFEGVGAVNPAVPAALREWSVPMEPARRGRAVLRYDPAAAKKLLAEAGYPKGFSATMDFTTYGSTVLVDLAQLVMKYLKEVGIEAKLESRRSTGRTSRRPSTASTTRWPSGRRRASSSPTTTSTASTIPGELKNQGHFNDPVVADMLIRQRRTSDPAKRKELIFEIQRYLAKQQYYVQMPSAVHVGVWDGALKNYAPNFGYDYGRATPRRLARSLAGRSAAGRAAR